MSKDDELIVGVEDTDLKLAGIDLDNLESPFFNPLPTDNWPPALFKLNGALRRRGDVETDPNWKQIIPYNLLYTERDGKRRYMAYRRGLGQGENRLHSQRSIGIGGHLNSGDMGFDLPSTIIRGMYREVFEEVNLSLEDGANILWPVHFEGLLYDASNPVGTVHLGVVMSHDVSDFDVTPREEDILDSLFLSVRDMLSYKDWEGWSSILLTHMSAETGRFF